MERRTLAVELLNGECRLRAESHDGDLDFPAMDTMTINASANLARDLVRLRAGHQAALHLAALVCTGQLLPSEALEIACSAGLVEPGTLHG